MINTNFVATGRYLVVDLGKENDTVEQCEFGLALQIAQEYAEAEETRTAVLNADTGEVLAIVEFTAEGDEEVENPMVDDEQWYVDEDDYPNDCEYDYLNDSQYDAAREEFTNVILGILGLTGEGE